MKFLVVVIVSGAFAVLVAGAAAKSDRPGVLLCISSQSYENGQLSTPNLSGPSCP
jgi:hypothetical protein